MNIDINNVKGEEQHLSLIRYCKDCDQKGTKKCPVGEESSTVKKLQDNK